jgi:isocitrate dehydrogenase (NAD+)
MMLSGMHMLKYLGEFDAADRIEKAISKILKDGRTVTCDIGGTAGTLEYMDQVITAL